MNDRLAVLKGRKVMAWPDVDGFQEWSKKLKGFAGLDVTVSTVLQQEATAEDLANHIDIADWLLRNCHPERSEGSVGHSAAFLRAARFLSPESNEVVEALIDDLGLEFMGAEKVEEEEVEASE